MAETYNARSIACAGKVPFRTRDQAQIAAGRKATRTPYHCRFCQAWHVGGDQRKQPRRNRRGHFARERELAE